MIVPELRVSELFFEDEGAEFRISFEMVEWLHGSHF